MSLDVRHRAPRLEPRTEWLSVHEAALLMGVSPATLRRWSDAGEIRTFTTPGGHRRFSRSAIAGLLPSDPASGPTSEQIRSTRRGIVRRVDKELRRLAAAAPWSTALDTQARFALGTHMCSLVDGVAAALDPSSPEARDRALTARRAAASAGEVAACRGIDLREMVLAGFALRSLVIRDLATAARRHDLSGDAASRWFEATCVLDGYLEDAMRGHEAVRRVALQVDDP